MTDPDAAVPAHRGDFLAEQRVMARAATCWVRSRCSQLSRSSPGTARTPRCERSTQPASVAIARCSRSGSP